MKTVTKEVERERNGGCLVVIVNKNERDRVCKSVRERERVRQKQRERILFSGRLIQKSIFFQDNFVPDLHSTRHLGTRNEEKNVKLIFETFQIENSIYKKVFS